MPGLEDASDATREKAAEPIAAASRRTPAHVAGHVRRIADGDILLQASSLAFYGLISVLRLLTIAFAVAGAVTRGGALDGFATSFSGRGPSGAGRIVDQLVSSAGSLSWVTLVFAVWPATAYGGGLRRALQHASGNDTDLAGIRSRLLGPGLPGLRAGGARFERDLRGAPLTSVATAAFSPLFVAGVLLLAGYHAVVAFDGEEA